MKKYFVIFGCFLAACSSNNSSETTTKIAEVQEVPVIDSTSFVGGCYTAILNQDTSQLLLRHKNGAKSISGELEINNFEKDRNKGTLNGEVEGDLIITWYDFQSEGVGSVRQVVFKIQGDTLYEGYGNLDKMGDTLYFNNIGALKYLTEKPYVKRDCP
ncbi:MAG: hypothetical protein ABIN48_14110 [Ginsengibacter sp.]